MKDEMIK